VSTVYPEPTRQDIQNAALDGIAIIGAAAVGDHASVEALYGTYSDPYELAQLTLALIAHGGALCRMAANASHIPVETIVGSVAATIREDAP
jgi:hypothetical protein